MKYLIGKNMSGKTYTLEEMYGKNKGNSIYIDINSKCEKERVDIDLESKKYKHNQKAEKYENGKFEEDINDDFIEILQKIKSKLEEINNIPNKSTGVKKVVSIYENIYYQNLNNITHIYIDEPDTNLDLYYMLEVIKLFKDLEKIEIEIIIATHSPTFIYYSNAEIKDISLLRGSYLIGDNEQITIGIENIRCIIQKIFDSFSEQAIQEGKKVGLNKLEFLVNDPDYLDCFLNTEIQSYEFISILFSEKIYLFEGYTEKIINDLVFEKENIDKFICSGKIFVYIFYKILEKYKKDVKCIIDRDNEDNNAHSEINKKFQKINSIFFENKIEEEFDIDDHYKNQKVQNAYKSFKSDENKKNNYINKLR